MTGEVETRSILHIEDDPADALLFRKILEGVSATRFQVVHVPTLQAADKRLKDPLSAILLDLDLPDSRGLATLARLREKAPHTPIIVLSGNLNVDLQRAALEHGAQAYLHKDEATIERLESTLMPTLGCPPQGPTRH